MRARAARRRRLIASRRRQLGLLYISSFRSGPVPPAPAPPPAPPEGDADWLNRIRDGAGGVLFSTRLDTDEKLLTSGTIDSTHWLLSDSTSDHVTFDPTTYPPGGADGSWRIEIRNTDGDVSGNPCIYHGPVTGGFGEGSTYWGSWRQKTNVAATYQPYFATNSVVSGPWTASTNYSIGANVYPTVANYTGRWYEVTTDGGSSGTTEPTWPTTVGATVTDGGLTWTCRSAGRSWAKLNIASNHSNSSVPNECVMVTYQGSNQLGGYHQNGSSFPNEEVSLSTDCNGSDFNAQPEIVGAANSLSGTNPDTGSAWSACEQDRRQYGSLFSSRSAANWRQGYGDPLGPQTARELPDQWATYTFRIEIGTWGSANSRYSAWVQHEGATEATMIFDSKNITLGDAADHDCFWPIHYRTACMAGGRSVASESAHIAGTTIHVVGNLTPLGAGTLSFDSSSSVRRFTWAGNGESAGTARGYSATNNILIINVAAASETHSYLVIEVDPANLPANDTGTYNNTVTIQQGRPLGVKHIADFIIDDKVIIGPGGVIPLGVSDLSDLAATMSSGDWEPFTMGGINGAFDAVAPGGAQPTTINGYGHHLMWDPVHHKMVYAGTAHTNAGGGPVDGSGRMSMWDEVTNQWTSTSYTGWEAGAPGHSYYHFIVNPANGDCFFRSYGGSKVWKRAYDGATTEAEWDKNFSTLNATGDGLGNVVGAALEFLPGANGGAGGLVFNTGLTVETSDSALTTWTNRSDTLPNNSSLHMWSVRSNGKVYFGGGSSSAKMFSIDASNSIDLTLPNSPMNCGARQDSYMVAHPNGVDLLCFGNTSTNYYRFDTAAGTWTGNLGPHEIDTPEGNDLDYFSAACTIPEYGVIVFIQNRNYSSPSCIVFKP